MIRNPDLVPPFSCRAAAGHMFHTANELHFHELVCPVVEELDYQHYGPTRFERPTEGGFTRAPTPTADEQRNAQEQKRSQRLSDCSFPVNSMRLNEVWAECKLRLDIEAKEDLYDAKK